MTPDDSARKRKIRRCCFEIFEVFSFSACFFLEVQKRVPSLSYCFAPISIALKLRGLPFFFSSGLAVNALWHGPDGNISGEKGDTQHNWLVSKSKAYHCTDIQHPTKARRPANPPARFAFRLKKKQNNKKNGAGPKQKHPT